MLRYTTTAGTFETDDPATMQLILDSANAAEQAALRKVYSVKTLAQRLEISERSAYELIRGGHVRYVCAGAKNYRVSELAVREFLGDR
jgi:excisionase family DNA binding protein